MLYSVSNKENMFIYTKYTSKLQQMIIRKQTWLDVSEYSHYIEDQNSRWRTKEDNPALKA